MITLVIKARSSLKATAACIHNDIKAIDIGEPNEFGEVIATCPNECWSDVVRWFCRDPKDGAPYDQGTLLHHGTIDDR